VRYGLLLAMLAATGCATAPIVRTQPPQVETLPSTLPPKSVAELVGWRDDKPLALASATWEPGGSARVQAVVLSRVADEHKEVVLALVRDDRLLGVVPLATVVSAPGKRRSVGATLAELPLGATSRALRVDVRSFEEAATQRFAVKTTIVTLAGDRPAPVLDRLVESGDRARDRRADLSVRDVDGDGTPELIIEEHESGAAPRTLVYRRGEGGRYVTKDRSIFDE